MTCDWNKYLDAAFIARLHSRADRPSLQLILTEGPQMESARVSRGMTQNQKRPTSNAERLKGSPPPELPNYVWDSALKPVGCKYTFRN